MESIIPFTVLSIPEYIMSNIGGAIISGLLVIISDILSGIQSFINDLVNSVTQMFYIPLTMWSNGLPVNYSIPVIFTLILGTAGLIAFFFIDAYGLENDVGDIISQGLSSL